MLLLSELRQAGYRVVSQRHSGYRVLVIGV